MRLNGLKLNLQIKKMFLKIKHFKRDFNKWTVLIVSVSLFLAIPVFSILISLFRGNGEMWEHITTYFLLIILKIL